MEELRAHVMSPTEIPDDWVRLSFDSLSLSLSLSIYLSISCPLSLSLSLSPRTHTCTRVHDNYFCYLFELLLDSQEISIDQLVACRGQRTVSEAQVIVTCHGHLYISYLLWSLFLPSFTTGD
jgi:hypothetical protein